MTGRFVSLKDLSFFEDGSIQLRSTSSTGSKLCVITSTLDVSSTWLVDAICGRQVSSSGKRITGDYDTSSDDIQGRQVVLVTFTNKTNLHIKGIKRYSGVDVASISKDLFTVIDQSNNLFNTRSQNKFSSNKLDDLLQRIKKSISSNAGTNKLLPIVVIESPDLLIGSGLYKWNDLTQFIHDIRKITSEVFVTCNGDEPVIIPNSPIGEDQLRFLTELIRNASVVVSLRAFETGRADDVTGILRICRGPHIDINEETPRKVIENEYLYHISDNVKLFYR